VEFYNPNFYASLTFLTTKEKKISLGKYSQLLIIVRFIIMPRSVLINS